MNEGTKDCMNLGMHDCMNYDITHTLTKFIPNSEYHNTFDIGNKCTKCDKEKQTGQNFNSG